MKSFSPIIFNLVCLRESVYGRVLLTVHGYHHNIYMSINYDIDDEDEFARLLMFRVKQIIKVTKVQRKSVFKYQTSLKYVWCLTINNILVRDVIRDITKYLGYDREFYNVTLNDTSLATELLLHNYMHIRHKDNKLPDNVTINIADIIVPASEEEEMSFVGRFPYRVLSIDIECVSGPDGSFPKADVEECEV